MVTAPCDLCAATSRDVVMRIKDWLYGVPGVYSLVKCASCGLISTDVTPHEQVQADWYPEVYAPHRPPDQRAVEDARRWLKERADARFGRLGDEPALSRFLLQAKWRKYYHTEGWKWRLRLPPGRMLDVGCGAGQVLLTYKAFGWDVYGVEIDADAARLASQYVGCHVHPGPFGSDDFPARHFDLILMNHSLEHLFSPSQALQRARLLLDPGGHLVIHVPNIASAPSLLFREYDWSLDVPRHLYHFSRRTLSRSLKKAQFRERVIRTSMSSIGLAHSRWLKHKCKRGEVPTGCPDIRPTLLDKCIGSLFDIAGLGSEIHCWASKD